MLTEYFCQFSAAFSISIEGIEIWRICKKMERYEMDEFNKGNWGWSEM